MSTLDASTSLDPRKSAVFFEDDLEEDKFKIQFEPSTELIADEYNTEEKSGLVLILRGNKKSDVENTLKILDIFDSCGYEIPEQNIIGINNKKDVQLKLKRISEEDHTNKSSLIVVFLGEIDTDDNFIPEQHTPTITTKDVWMFFISCPTLKAKPKVFIFLACKIQRDVELDAVAFASSWKEEYNIPSEADMLIIYKKVEGTGPARLKFINEFCTNIKNYGQRDDIIGLVTHTDHTNEKRPLIISTLTRKFYIVSSQFRDHYFDIEEQQNDVINTIEELTAKITELESSDKKRKVKSTSSFRRLVNTIKLKKNNHKEEETMEVDGSSGSGTQAKAVPVVTDSSPVKKRPSKNPASPRPVLRKKSNVDKPKWVP